MNKNPSIINIVLEQSTSAKEFKASNIIHQSKFDSIIEKVKHFSKYDLKSEYSHNTITLLGTRGSGKTSFLLSLKSKLEEEPGVEVLDIIDPTLIEEKGHVFLNLISIICDLVDSKLKDGECNPNKDIEAKRRYWRSLVSELASGLPSIDGVAKHSELKWEDPRYVMDIELKSVKAARKLSENFDEFLRNSLEILGKKVFLVLFDDIDVDSSKGYAVLETIRKYFTTGKIITVLSGDLRLYNTLIRQKKWSNFGDEIIKYEGSSSYNSRNASANMAYYTDMVTDLTSQYLLKIMQPQHRYHLGTLYELLNSSVKPIVNITKGDAKSSMELLSVLEQIFNNLGIRSRAQLESQIHFLLNQPLRTIIHFLQQILQDNPEFAVSEQFDVLSILLTDLYEKYVNTELLTNSPLFLNIEIIKLLIREGQLKELYQLSPTSDDNSLNASVFAFNIIFSQNVKKYKFLIFDYLVRVSFLRNIIDYYPEGFFLNSGIVKTSGVQNDLVLRDIMNQLQIYFYAMQGKKSSNFTLIRLRGLKGPAKQSGMEDSLDFVLGGKEINNVKRILGYMPTLAASYTTNNNTRIFYSIGSLLSCIGELVKRYENHKDKKIVLESLIEFSQLRYYTIDDDTVGQSDQEESIIEFDEELVEESLLITSELSEYSDLVHDWLKSSEFENISVHLLGKSFTRFFITITNINRENKSENLGRLFHLNVIGFLNSILVEDARENLSPDLQHKISVNQNNIVTSDKILIDNMKSLKIEVEKTNEGDKERSKFIHLPFSQWFFSCPLLLSYIDTSQTELMELIGDFVGEGVPDVKFNIHDVLNKVGQYTSISPTKLLANVPKRTKSTLTKDVKKYLEDEAFRREGDIRNVIKPSDWKQDESLSKEVNFEELLAKFLSSKIDLKNFFSKSENDHATGEKNKIIKKEFPLFGDDKRSARKIKKFRTFLETKGLI